MVAMKHTPGPWKIVDSIYNPEAPEIHGNGIRVCNMTHGAHGQTPEGKANTKLIAAAPDMLKALLGVISHNNGLKEEYQISPSLIDQVKQAINKATE